MSLAPLSALIGAPAAEASPAWWESIPWLTILLILLGVVLLAVVIWALLRWRRRRAGRPAPEDTGSAIGWRLRRVGTEFYAGLPEHARHFPTYVVFGETGAGKSTVIDGHVDWRGQSHLYAPPVDGDDLVQLYLGPDLVVHEVSSMLLRDNGKSARIALRSLWREIRTTVTVVLVVDATTLLDMDAGARRELAQWVRGKLSLFPKQARGRLELRLYLSKLDLVPGYLHFAATLGGDHPAIPLGGEDGQGVDAAALVRAFDEHLSYALVQLGGGDFDRLVSFHDRLPELIGALTPILTELAKKDLHGARYGARGLYLGSQVPNSHVGELFAVDRGKIETSITRRVRRVRLRAVALAVVLFGGVTGLTVWHRARVGAAQQAVDAFGAVHDKGNVLGKGGETTAKAEAYVAADALERMRSSEWLWMRWAFEPNKHRIDAKFENIIYTHYLEPRLKETSRVKLIYLTSLIFATRDTPLGDLIVDHHDAWAMALDLEPWVIKAYIESSIHQRQYVELPPPAKINDDPGKEWNHYLHELSRLLKDEAYVVPREGFVTSKPPPKLYSPDDYKLLEQARELMLENERRPPINVELILKEPIAPWHAENYEQLSALLEIIQGTKPEMPDTSTWGLARLVQGLRGVRGPSESAGFTGVALHDIEIASSALDAVVARSSRHYMIDAVLERIDREPPMGGRQFFDSNNAAPAQGMISGFGGGPRGQVEGIYTRFSFEREVRETLDFANASLYLGAVAEDTPKLAFTDRDRDKLDLAIKRAAAAYAAAYQQELLNYYSSFEFHPGSEMSLPYAIKPFAQPSSWFTKFLQTVSRNAVLEFPEEDPGAYFEPQRAAMADFTAIAALLLEDSGRLPGLEPYQGLIAALQKELTNVVGDAGDPEATELLGRLSTIGAFALGVEAGLEQDYEALILEWLSGADLDPEWYEPFLAPVRQVEYYGRRDVEAKVKTAWMLDVRPIARPTLAAYPFNPEAGADVDPEELERVFRRQGDIPGDFWEAFDRLIGPALREHRVAMIPGVKAPFGMLTMVRDLDTMSGSLWDDKGERVELKTRVLFGLLPVDEFEGRRAAMVSLSTGGGSVYGFNQKPRSQVLSYKWWEQGLSTVAVTMERPGEDAGDPDASARYRLMSDAHFGLFRLLDRGRGISSSTRETTLTGVAMYRATRCGRHKPQRTRGAKFAWAVPLGAYGGESLDVTVTLVDDPWEAFAIRKCGWAS